MMDANSLSFISTLFALPFAFVIDPFAVPLVFGICLRTHLIHDPALLAPEFQGFGSTEFIAVAGALYVLHAVADKFPPFAHLFDLIGLAAKPAAVALIGLWTASRLDPGSSLHWVTLAVLVAGGTPAAAALQVLRTKVRLGASALTLGGAVPAISAVENMAGLSLCALAFTHPISAVLVIAVVGLPVLWLSWKLVRAASHLGTRFYRAGRSALIRT